MTGIQRRRDRSRLGNGSCQQFLALVTRQYRRRRSDLERLMLLFGPNLRMSAFASVIPVKRKGNRRSFGQPAIVMQTKWRLMLRS